MQAIFIQPLTQGQSHKVEMTFIDMLYEKFPLWLPQDIE